MKAQQLEVCYGDNRIVKKGNQQQPQQNITMLLSKLQYRQHFNQGGKLQRQRANDLPTQETET